MFKNIINKIFKKNQHALVNDIEPICLEGVKTISLWTAGILYESRINNVLSCKVHDEVLLIREPNNGSDLNAIHVRTLKGESLGYIGRSRAAKIAPLIDENKIDPKAYITELKCDLSKEIYGVKISFCINPVHIYLFSQKEEAIDVFFDKSDSGNLYLLLKCEQSILKSVKELFKENNLDIYRSGISYRIAKNGRYYDWYFFLSENEDQELIQKLLEDRFPILKEKSDNEFKELYYSSLEEDIVNLKKTKQKLVEEDLPLKEKKLNTLENYNSLLLEENTKLKCNLEKSNKLLDQGDNQLEKTISVLFPEVVFLNPSFDVLQREVLDFSKALCKIRSIVFDANFKGKPIRTLDNWFDIHFSTGERNDGRIYFKKSNGKITILVSFKGEQSKDIKRLSKY
jgi:hypothetical protein